MQVIADKTANPVFVASDLLSQAEHGIDSQVVLVAIDLDAAMLEEIEVEVDRQARALPRVDIIKQAIKKSLIVKTQNLDEAMTFSNEYAPEHLILHLADSPGAVKMVNNAGSVFVGAFSPERSVVYRTTGRAWVLNHIHHLQLRRLCVWYKSHAPDVRIRSTVQRRQHALFPKAHHLAGAHARRSASVGSYRCYARRAGGTRGSRERRSGQAGRAQVTGCTTRIEIKC